MESTIQLEDLQTNRYAQLSSCSLIMFDHLITLNDEVTLIWNSAWSPGKILFLVNRYYNLGAVSFNVYALFLATKSNEVRLRWSQWQGWTGIIAFMLAEAILQLRIYALYSLNKRLLVVMLILYFACSACSAWVVINELSSISMTASISPAGPPPAPLDGSSCFPQFLPRGIFRYWIPMLSYESLLCVLVLFQGFRRFRSDSSIFRSGKRLVSSLIRDSVIYFLVLFVTYLTCLLVWALARKTFPIGFSVTMSCIMANRMVLNCRKISESVTCTVIMMGTTGKTKIVADNDDNDGDPKDVAGKREVLSVFEEESGEGSGLPTLDFQSP